MAAAAVLSNPSAVERVSSLPLVSSTYGLLSSVYSGTKHTHRYLRSVCEAAELGVRSLGSAALLTAAPIIHRLEPQIAVANDLACKGLDRIEKRLPILHRPSEQIVSSAKDAVSSARDSVSDTLSTAVERTRGAVLGGMDRTRAAVSGSIGTILESRVVRLVSSGVDTALSTSESLVDQYLPGTEDEQELETRTLRGFDAAAPSYYVRLECLSTRLRQRAYSRAVSKILEARRRGRSLVPELQSPADLIQYGRKSIQLSALWGSGGPAPETGHDAQVMESRTLALARSLTQQLQTTCLVLVSSLQGLPTHLQQEALSLSHSASHAYLSVSRVRLDRVRESLDGVMDYMVNNTPLNWLVGPFYPHMVAVETPAVSPQDRPVAPPPAVAPPPPEVCEEVEPPPEEVEPPQEAS
ncbi:perilipin-2 isoform X2 [Takifugu rubripes]|uniref:perilipin-2 isoform X2 n=1 Tax=Takifugu rubripes TaxID=31033 RepID=UPI001145B847|nr:perilipin-2 isoform X2 [Takifugu rubripes]